MSRMTVESTQQSLMRMRSVPLVMLPNELKRKSRAEEGEMENLMTTTMMNKNKRSMSFISKDTGWRKRSRRQCGAVVG